MRSSLTLLATAAAAAVLAACGSTAPVAPATVAPAPAATTPSSSGTAATSAVDSRPSSAPSSSHDPCALLTAADIVGVLGGTFEKAQSSSTVCGYADVGANIAVAVSTGELPPGLGGGQASDAVRAAAATSGGAATPIDGLGDAAAGSHVDDKTLVAFVRGSALVVVALRSPSVTDPQNRTLALARIAAGRV